jgi:hypothetical protein
MEINVFLFALIKPTLTFTEFVVRATQDVSLVLLMIVARDAKKEKSCSTMVNVVINVLTILFLSTLLAFLVNQQILSARNVMVKI